MKALRRFLSGVMPAGLTGAFLIATAFRVMEPSKGLWLGPLVFGWVYGVGVLGLTRLFRVSRWGVPVVGLVCGPVPVVLLLPADVNSGEERAGLWLLGAIVGLLIGLVEAARLRKVSDGEAASDADSS